MTSQRWLPSRSTRISPTAVGAIAGAAAAAAAAVAGQAAGADHAPCGW